MASKDSNFRSTPAWVLALKWSPDKELYNLHGLWYDRSPRPGSITEDFDPSMISDELLQEMEINWNSDRHKKVQLTDEEQEDSDEGKLDESDKNEEVLLQSDYHFWAHEWNKHGKIAGMTPDTYFRTALKLLDDRKQRLPKTKIANQYRFNLDENLTETSSTLPTNI